MRVWKLMSAVAVATSLVACGGGGGGGTGYTPSSSITYTLVAPTALSSYPSVGVASTTTARTDYATAQTVFAVTSDSATTYDAYTSAWESFGPIAHLTDLDVSNAWNSGWTGKGVNISVIDDFSTNSTSYYSITNSFIRTKTETTYGGYYNASYSVSYKHFETTSHGQWVSNIVGGDYTSTPVVESIKYDVSTDTIVTGSCNATSTNQYFAAPSCDTNYHGFRYSWNGEDINATRTRILVPGIAGEALVTNNNINLSSTQDPIKTVADIQGHLRNSANYDVINLSLGVEVPTTGRTFNEVMASVENEPLTTQQSAVITVAAGNGGAPCANDDLSGCNAVAVALAFQNETKNSTIVVGALAGTGAQENIATYSTRAGVLADRFILAQGTIGFWNTVVGTSFAAPRVAGVAAILKQKYPSLTGKQIADVILLSASKDINNDGTDDFTGVSPIYGHGKLSLTRALALAGAI